MSYYTKVKFTCLCYHLHIYNNTMADMIFYRDYIDFLRSMVIKPSDLNHLKNDPGYIKNKELEYEALNLECFFIEYS